MVDETLPGGSSDPPTSCTDSPEAPDSCPLARVRVLYTLSEFTAPSAIQLSLDPTQFPGEVVKEAQADSLQCALGGRGWGHDTKEASHVQSLTLSHLDEAKQDDESQGQQLGSSKGVLHAGGGLHAVAVHSREQHCGEEGRERSVETPQAGAPVQGWGTEEVRCFWLGSHRGKALPAPWALTFWDVF